MHAIYYNSASDECNQPKLVGKSIEGCARYLFYCVCMVCEEEQNRR